MKTKNIKSYIQKHLISRWGFNLLDTFGNKNKFWVDVNWSKASDSLVLRDIPGEITTIGKERAQNLKQTIVINSVYNNLSFKLEHEGYQTFKSRPYKWI